MRNYILILFALIFLTACTETKSVEEGSLQPVSVSLEDTMKIVVDPRIEILTVIQYLGDYFKISELDSQYKKDIDEYFDEYRDHAAVTKFKELSQIGFSYDAPITLLISSGQLPELEFSYNAPDHVFIRAGGFNNAREFLEDVNDFYEITNFKSFFEEHNELYNEMILDYQSKISNDELINTLESYYGMTQNSYTIILAPMLHFGGYGPKIETEDNKYDIYSVVGPTKLVDSKFEFELTSYLILHEFGHSFVNPLTDLYIDEVMKYDYLYEEIKGSMSKMAYGNWPTTVNEHIVRAVVARMILAKSGDEEYNQILEMELEKEFIYMGEILKKLEDYENNRDEYKSLEEFYPELVQAFENY